MSYSTKQAEDFNHSAYLTDSDKRKVKKQPRRLS
jgi:hypothetical protein